MESLPTLINLVFFSFIVIFFIIPVHSIISCIPVFCHSTIEPVIMFPFQLSNQQHSRCGYPGFDLHCNSQNQTIINLPQSGEFTVHYIDYMRQTLYINDPNSCLPGRLLNFSLSGSRFQSDHLRNYTFLNCSSRIDNFSYRYELLDCLSGINHTVLAMNSHLVTAQVPSTCRIIANVMVPVQWQFSMFSWSPRGMTEDLELIWTEPDCSDCGNRGGICGYNGNSGLQIGCSISSRRGLTRGVKYGIAIGIGIPGLICITGLACYFYGIAKSSGLNHNLNSELPITRGPEQHLAVRSPVIGLDGSTIESYPSMVLGQSRRLPKPSDVTCPICLSDYEVKEMLRSIPDCNHYFHADCIDEWLKLNGTCPLCRNSPESSTATPCSSMSLSSPSLAASDDH